MANGITVNELGIACVKLMKKGLGEKTVLITSDDEGNGYHTLYYLFNSDVDDIREMLNICYSHDEADPEEVVLLG